MSDPSFLTYQFSQQVPQTTLTNIGAQLGAAYQQQEAQRILKNNEITYNQALEAVYADPTNANISALYQAAEPLGRFDNARAAVNDLFARMPEAVAEDPKLVAYRQAYEEWAADPMNEALQMRLRRVATEVGLFDEANTTITDVVSGRVSAADEQILAEAIAAYEADPTNNILYNRAVTAANRLGRADQTRMAMDAIFERLSQEDRDLLRDRQWAEYNRAMGEYRRDRSPENFDTLLQKSLPLGVFDEAQTYISSLTDEEREADVAMANSILTPLSIRDQQAALSALGTYVAGTQDPTERQYLQELQQLIQDGKLDEAQDAIYMSIGQTPQGREYLGQLYALNQDRRAEAATGAQLIQVADQLRDFATQEQVDQFVEAANGLPYNVAQALAEFAAVMPSMGANGSTMDDILDREENLRKEYDSSTEAFFTMGRAAEQIRRLIETGNASGFSDNAITVLFNKVTDPPSVVRESEAARTEASQSAMDRLRMALPRVIDGTAYAPEAKQDILDALDELTKVADEGESMIRGRLMNTVDYMWGNNTDGRAASVNRIFPPIERVPIGTLTEPTLDLARNLIRDRFPNVGPQVVPGSDETKTIEEMSLSELQNAFPSAWEMFFGNPDVIPTGSSTSSTPAPTESGTSSTPAPTRQPSLFGGQ